MTHINEIMSADLLREMIDLNYVTVRAHPTYPINIYNYSHHAQFDAMWNGVTLQCRGLIVNDKQLIIARPFKKFFNYEEIQYLNIIPKESFEVYTKVDGALGILYWYNDIPYISTRGSFASPQAIAATKILHDQYAHTIPLLQRNKTYLFEIICSESKIVVDYGSQEMLVLLSIIDTDTGQDEPLQEIGFPIVEKHDGINDFTSLVNINKNNFEGFVIKFKNGFRLKIKTEEYKRLHKILTNVSNIAIWEYLRFGKKIDEILDRVPDEFYKWIHDTIDELKKQYNAIENISKSEFKQLDDRKSTALYFQTCKYPHVLFAMLDNKNYADIIWKKIRPEFSKPFRNNIDG